MILRTTFVLAALAINAVTSHRTVALNFTMPVQPGEVIIISGKGISDWRGAIRFENTRLDCNGRKRSTNPLVLLLLSRKRKIQIGEKTPRTRCGDRIVATKGAREIAVGRKYTLKIYVSQRKFRLKVVTGPNRERLIYTGNASLQSVDVARARSGEYFSLRIKRNIALPLMKECGVRGSGIGITARIARGQDSVAGEYPWQTALRKKYAPTWNPIIHICGGTLIHSCWVLTAAHCTDRVSDFEDDYYVRVGDFNNSNHEEPLSNEDQQDHDIDRVFLHPLFTRTPKNPINDVSLIKLKYGSTLGTCASFSRYVLPACLPVVGSDTFATNVTCDISGWGASVYHQSYSDFPEVLKKGYVYLIGPEVCRAAFGNGTHSRVQDGMICAGGKSDTCQGDSGGPLACQRQRDRAFVVWGITSWGEKCAAEGKPGVYTDVSHFMNWIMKTISLYFD